MSEKIANPGPLGLAAFGLTTLILNFVNAGIVPAESLGMVLPMGIFYGGACQVYAGMWEMKKGNTFGATAFTSYGAFWLGLSLMFILQFAGVIPPVPKPGLAILLGAWGLFTAYMTVATLKKPKALQTVFITLTILFFLLAIGQFSHTVHIIAGYEGILTALTALYLSAAEVINETYGREVLPIGQ
ncbi:MAG: cation symporter [Candidatus Methanofastidiosum methylothiophilum]|uniref:Cation symporter n=1 Tax=Candidatus Methanofastidiosum methylothiophilum TaxID=1705564 RepID=A0A150IYD5_9EURY|nr:MAG: cation symporter [Candidatus Methanofastidiosum methylthiophilus]NMC75695.1 acetate uptake transporter [Candidatus Methanofastidiosa archaeon]